MMNFETLKQLTQEGESDYAPTPPSGRSPPKFTLEDFVSKFRSFLIQNDLIYVVGSTVTQGQGADVDLLIRDEFLPDRLKEAIAFRLYRWFSDAYDIPYDETPKYLHLIFGRGPYTDCMRIANLKVEKVENPEVIKMHLEVLCKSKDRIIAGYASVITIDSQNDLISKRALETALDKFLKNDEYRNVMAEHTSVQVGKVIDEYKGKKTHVDDYGLYIVCKIRDDTETANAVWSDILDGNLNGFSIHAEVPEDGIEIQNDVRVITKMNLLEISITSSPANERARFEVISKSKSNVKCQEKESEERNMSEELEKNEEEYTLEKIDTEAVDKEVKAEESTESIEKKATLDDVVDALNRIAGILKEIAEKDPAYPFPGKYPYYGWYPGPGMYPYEKSIEKSVAEDAKKSNAEVKEKSNAEVKEKLSVEEIEKSLFDKLKPYTKEISTVKDSITERNDLLKSLSDMIEKLDKKVLKINDRINKLEESHSKKSEVNYETEPKLRSDVKFDKDEVYIR